MEKYIYKITNLINGKSYIGQTNNYKRRFTEHKAKNYGADEAKILYDAIDKYGIENFSFEVIEDKTENYNEREKYWIAYYHTYVRDPECWGYNLTPGGDEPPILKGADNPNTTHLEEDVDKIRQLLIKTKLSTKEIGEMFNYDDTAITRINKGEMWYNEKYSYPLRKELTHDFKQQRAFQIMEDLRNTKLSHSDIAKKYGVGRSTVTAINRGQNFKQPNVEYPIRK